MSASSRTGLGGLVAFAATPTAGGEGVDEPRLCALLDELVAAGVDAVTVLGSTGALATFDERERMRIAAAAIAHVDRRVPVMVGTGAMTTAEAVRLARHAEDAGADAVLVVPLAYWRLADHELLEHYHRIAGAVRIPVGIYNNPRLTLTDLQPQLIARIARRDNVRYLKESSADPERIARVRSLAPQLQVAAGRDSQALEALRAHPVAWYSGIANIIPRQCVALFGHCRAGDFEAAAAAG
ncbi:MAG TPA: dihydrodipicolinate synthase family protein, partial [Myxococcota bacterium]|nr:dihydrodipicolinate synthase family protein [Myxococcota bacterium]